MELVYLWVDDYKNIKEQGFNFSPRFDCNYDKELNILTIDRKKDYLSIFPSNINITAIVGQNGSGKSSVIFQDQRRGQGFSSNFKIFYENNMFEIHEPYIEFGYNNAPYMEQLNIKNNTSIEYRLKSVYSYLNFDLKDKQGFISEPTENSLDDNFSIHFNWDILKYFSMDEYYNTYSYGTWVENPNILIPLMIEKGHSISYKYFLAQINSKIKNFVLTHKKEAKLFFEHFNFKLLEEVPTSSKIINIFSLSNGERYQFLLLFILLEESFVRNKNLIIYLDEPDLTLHPKWQKELIKKSIEVFSLFPHNLHLVISSHSPFILSDLPKENVIFLKDGKQIDALEKKQTFGANIHTLLSDGFFMDGGLMGEFAKGKIEEIKNFYELVKKCEKIIKESEKVKSTIQNIYLGYENFFKHIQSIIGEPFLKTIVKNYLDELDILFNGKKQFLDTEIKRLQELQKNLDD